MHITDSENIQISCPLPRETIRTTKTGYLASCFDCQWQGLFPDGTLADDAVGTHYDRCHYGPSSYTLVFLVDDTRAQCLESNRGRLTPIQSERPTFPRTTGDVSELVTRGDLIRLPGDREQMVVAVTEQRALGLPTWTVTFCDPDVDLLDDDPDWRGKNELIACDGDAYCRYGESYLGAPSFEIAGRAEHQADLSSYRSERLVTDGGTGSSGDRSEVPSLGDVIEDCVVTRPLPADHELDEAECHNCGEPWDEDEWDVRHLSGGPSIGETWKYKCPGCERETFEVGT